MQVPYDEGVAIRIGPESCADSREAAREALTGVCIGQPLSGESDFLRGADGVSVSEGNTVARGYLHGLGGVAHVALRVDFGIVVPGPKIALGDNSSQS